MSITRYGFALWLSAAFAQHVAAHAASDGGDFVRVPGLRNPCFAHNGSEFCLPHTYIVGMPKAGTSALWHKLSAHPLLNTVPGVKEFCPADNWPSLENVLAWGAAFAKPGALRGGGSAEGHGGGGGAGGGSADSGSMRRSSSAVGSGGELGGDSGPVSGAGGESGAWERQQRLVLNGCIGYGGIRGRRYFKLLQEHFNVTDFRVLLLVRDYPSWLYAGWNFWCWRELGDEGCEPPNFWSVPGAHARSPQLWHALVSNESEIAKYPYYSEAYMYRDYVGKLEGAVGRARLLVLAQEDLQERPLGTLRRVEGFLGLPPARYSAAVLRALANHHSAKGPDAILLDAPNEAGGGGGAEGAQPHDGGAVAAAMRGGTALGDTDTPGGHRRAATAGGRGGAAAAAGSTPRAARIGAGGGHGGGAQAAMELPPMLPETRAVLEARWAHDCAYMRDVWGVCLASCCDRSAAARGGGGGDEVP